MTRPLRIEYAGALYHVTARGNARERIFLDDDDRREWLGLLGEICAQWGWVVHAYCLMDNHYHVLLETREGHLSQGMRQLNGVYTQRFNRRHGRVGHGFQGRYKAILVQKETYLLELARYVVLNPVRAGMVRSAKDWPWSSYRATAGMTEMPAWLSVDWLLSAFGRRRVEAIDGYRRFVSDGRNQPSPWEELRNQVYLGEAAFVEALQAAVDQDQDLSEIPATQRRPPAKTLDEYAALHPERDDAIAAAYASGGHSLKAIGDHFGLHYSRVSRIVKAQGKAKGKT